MNAIEVRNIKKRFRQVDIVKGISFEVKKGEVFGFLGKNGAGKTTTINILTGISNPSQGEFSIFNVPGNRIDEIKKKIGVLPDAANFYHEMTGLQHMVFFSQIKNKKSKSSKELLNILEGVGLIGHEYKKVGKYSFGMKKKLGIAQALIGNPDLIFLDEPTSGLDPESAREIQLLIQTLSLQGKTIFLTSHNLDEVERLCQRIAIMENGLIRKIGTMEQLVNEYINGIPLKISTGPIKDQLKEMLTHEFDCTELLIKHREINCIISNVRIIPLIIAFLVNQGIEIFSVESKKVSLEDIFLQDSSYMLN